MSEEKENSEILKSKSTFVKRGLKYIMILLIIFLVFSISIIILSQFKFFRNFALKQILNIVNNELIADIEIEDLTFANFEGINLKGVRLITDGDTLANIPELIINLNYEQLLNQKVNVSRIVFVNPKIRILRNSLDSIWNYDKIAFPSLDTTDSGPSPWEIKVKHLEFRNAAFVYYDSTQNYINYSTMDYSHLKLDNFDLLLSADIKLKDNYFSAKILNLKALESYSDLNINSFKAKFNVSPELISVKEMIAEINNSDFDISAEMTNYDIFDPIKPLIIEDAEFKLSAKGFNINDEIIYKFAVIPISFGSESDIQIDAEGKLNDMKLQRLNLKTGKSDIHISGKLKNMLETDDFEYILSLDNSEILKSDIIKTLKSIDLAAIPEFGFAETDRLYVHGFIDSVYSDLSIKTSIGDIIGKAGINYGEEKLRYFADFHISAIDLLPIIQDNQFKSNLNGRIAFKGIGSEIGNMIADIETDLKHSQIYGMSLEKFSGNINILNDSIRFDSLLVKFDNPQPEDYENEYSDYNQFIILDGNLDLLNINNPSYNINLSLNSVNLQKILHNNSLPDNISAKFDINMQGIELDSLLGTINSEITWLGFNDRAFLPFNFNSDISISDPGKTISLKSDFFTIDVIGKYSLAEILESLSFQGEYLANYFINKIDSFNHIGILNSDTLDLANQFPMMYNFPNIDAVFRAEILDLSPVNLFVDSMSIYSGIKLDVRMMSSENQSSIFLDSIKLDNFDFYSKDLQLKTGPLFLEGRIITTLSDSQLSIENLVLSIDTSGSISYNGTEINSLFTQLSYDGSNLGYNISGILESDFKINSAGKIGLNNSDISFRSDSTSFEYGGLFKWNTTEPIKAHISPEIINIEKFVFERDSSETISLSGSIENNIAKDLSLKINNFPVTDFLAFSSDDTKEKYEGVKFTVDSIRIRANGDLNEPRIVSFFALDSIVFSDYQIGNLRGRMIHNNTYIHGFVDIVHPALENKKILGIEVNYLPLYLGTNPNVARLDSNKMMDIRLKAAGLPLEILTPFAVGVKEMTGFLDANIVVEGSILKGIEYSGSASTENAIVKIQNTNIAYNTDLKVDFVKDKITLTKVSLKNLPQDVRFGRLGKADINGSIGLKDFDIGELDITLNADRLLVMSDATMVPMPDLYGDFIISTEKNHLRFYGTLDKPNLVGDVNIIHGHLKMPMESKKQNIRTYFTYTVMDDKVRLQSNTMKDTNYKANEKLDAGLSPSIADLINYDLSAKILGKFIVEMDMDLIGSMYAVIGTQDRLQTLRYEKKRDWNEGKLFGEVVVMEPSTIKSWKQFSARGTINFPAGSIENPSLNLKALHTGQMVENGTRKEFVVEMTITGPKDNPVIDMTYYIDGVKASGAVDQIKEDALYLLVMGRTKTGTGGGSPNSSLLNEGFASGVSNFATKALSDILMGTGVINSAEFDFQGGSMNLGDARLRLTGQLYGGISWTIGGTVADLSSNNQITIDIPASEFSNNPFWSNFVLQLSKASSNVIASSQEAKNWEVKVKLGSSW